MFSTSGRNKKRDYGKCKYPVHSDEVYNIEYDEEK